jgi:ribonucleoside-diphosphate reductase beta chain
VPGTWRHITAPECRQDLLRQACELRRSDPHPAPAGTSSSRSAWASGRSSRPIIRSRRSATRTSSWIPFIEVINDPAFNTGTLEDDQKLLKSISVFACLMEGLAGVLAYAGLVILLRINGNRPLSKMNSFDLMVTVDFDSTHRRCRSTITLSRQLAGP